MVKCLKYWLIFALLPFWACSGNEEKGASDLSPEEVVRTYQAFIDNNDFEKAMAMSSPQERARLKIWAGRILSNQYRDSTILNTIFLDVDCEIAEEKAYCLCLVEDDYERYQTEYVLVRIGSQWLVDAPEETFEIDQESINRMLENVQ